MAAMCLLMDQVRYVPEGVEMKDSLIRLTYEIELLPDEKITLPETVMNAVGPGDG
jgi:hypothetical protein